MEFSSAEGSMKIGIWEVVGVTSNESSLEVFVEASDVDIVTIGYGAS